GSQNLWGAAERVGILHAGVILAMRFPDGRVREEVAEECRRPSLPRVRTGIMDARIESDGRSPSGLEAHRTRGVRGPPKRPGIVDQESRQARLGLRPVMKARPSFAWSTTGVRPAARTF